MMADGEPVVEEGEYQLDWAHLYGSLQYTLLIYIIHTLTWCG